MSLLSFFRKNIFWTTDYVKGSPIRKHYNIIKYIHENNKSQKATSIKDAYLNDILKHAMTTTNFYKKASTSSDFKDFPVINKDIVRTNYEDFKSDIYSNTKNTQVSTGGSTGTPFKLFHNTNKRHRHLADNIYYAEKGGYGLGDKLYLLRAWHKSNLKSTILSLMKNMKLYGIVNYTDNDMKKLLSDIQNDKKTKCIVCFASMCDILVNYLDSSSNKMEIEDLRIKSIITDGDSLSKITKDKMEHYFDTPTVARYGNMECGILGQQSYSGGYNYELNHASYYFEVLDLQEDIPAKPGQIGRIVVTDLFNYCMPLIRYDTGDLASYTSINNEKVFERIEGRKVDLIFNTNGDTLSPYMVVQKMSEYSELKQFQFVQNSPKNYTFKLNPWNGNFSKEQELITDSKSYLGKDANITIEYVEEVPLLSSGKRKQVLNAM